MEKSSTKKPSLSVCPEKFCFLWLEKGVLYAPELYSNINEGFKDAKLIESSHCGSPFGVCTRMDSKNGDTDWYEPNESNLKQAGLPWFYFCNPNKLGTKDRKRYNKYFEDEEG